MRPGSSHLQHGGRGVEPRRAGRALPSERPSPRPLAAPSPVPGRPPCARRCPGLCGRRGGGREENAGTATRGAGPELGAWKELGELPPGLGPSAGAVSSSPPKLELGVGAVRAVKGPEHLKEQCTWGSKACGRGRLLSPGWDRLGAQSLRPVAPGPGPALRGLEGRQRSSRLREELDRRSGPGAGVIS